MSHSILNTKKSVRPMKPSNVSSAKRPSMMGRIVSDVCSNKCSWPARATLFRAQSIRQALPLVYRRSSIRAERPRTIRVATPRRRRDSTREDRGPTPSSRSSKAVDLRPNARGLSASRPRGAAAIQPAKTVGPHHPVSASSRSSKAVDLRPNAQTPSDYPRRALAAPPRARPEARASRRFRFGRRPRTKLERLRDGDQHRHRQHDDV